uniref:Secreted ookinete protein n=1 Tax=Strongyloides stercoralis TaxID=6248 RepID=A0A0K0DZQ4_STRER
MFINNILITIFISYLYAIPQNLHLEFLKNEENSHRHSIDLLEPELAISIFSNLPINPQKRTTVRPIVKKIKKTIKPLSELDYLVRVKKNLVKDLTSPDYINLNNDFLNSDNIMFSYDETSDEMKQVKSFNKNFLHQTINKNVKQQVFVNDKLTLKKEDKKSGDIETVTVVLPSQDIQIDKEEKNWEKTMKNNFVKKNVNSKQSNEKNINEKDKIEDTNNFDDFFNNFGAFTDDSVISIRNKRDIKKNNLIPNLFIYKHENTKNERKIRIGNIKIELEKMTFNKLDNSTNEDIIKIDNKSKFINSIDKKDENNENIINFQTTTELSQLSEDKEDTLSEISHLDNNQTISSSFLNNSMLDITLSKNDSLINEKINEIDTINNENFLIVKNDTFNNTTSFQFTKKNNSINSTKLDLPKNEKTKKYWITFFNNGTTRREMFTESIKIDSIESTTLPFDEVKEKLNNNKTQNLLSNSNSENNTIKNFTFNGINIENIATFPNDVSTQDDFIDNNSIYSDVEIIKNEKPLKYKNYSMDLPSNKPTTKKTNLLKEKKIRRKIHNFRSHHLHSF